MDRAIRVLSYAGSRAEERPRAPLARSRAVAVTDVLWAWIEAGLDTGSGRRRWFHVRLETAEQLTLYYDEALEAWFTPQSESGPPEAGGRPA